MSEYNSKTNKKDCRMFLDYLDKNKAEEAYEIFKKNPNLIDELKIWEIPLCYSDLIKHPKNTAAYYFFLRTTKRIMSIFTDEIPFLHLFEKNRENEGLERLLKEISEKSKKMLEEMDKNNPLV